MFRTVYSRLLFSFILILLFALLLQSVLITQLFRRNYYDEVKGEMIAGAQQLSGLAGRYFEKSSEDNAIAVSTAITAFTLKYDATLWVVNRWGAKVRIEARSGISGLDEQDLAQALTQEEIDQFLSRVLEGEVVEGSFPQRFEDPTLTIGYPITVYGEIQGAILIHTKISTLNNNIDPRYYYTIGLFFLGTMLLGALLILGVSRSIARPLRQMNEIAGEIAHGRFDKQVEVRSRDEIGQLAESFNAMARELKKHEQLQGGFVANVSHELRSPMTSMQGFAQGMLDGTIPAVDHDKYLAIIRDESIRLTKLIRELLDLAQIESGQFPLHIQRFDVNELIRRVLVRFIDRIEEKNVELEVEFKPEYSYVMADSDRIEQVVVNLIDNAVKYVDEGGRIRLWTYQSSDRVMVSVGNSGNAIPEEDLPFVFERFYKVDKSHTGRKGTGLGLSIVRRILDQHEEAITVHSKPGTGTTFAFSLKRGSDPESP